MSDASGVHAAYRRLLLSREVQELARRFALDQGVRYEFVDERRSFHGKAIYADGQARVRLPCNDRPEPYLLLTLLHEWAHLLAMRQARRRPVPPHGREWQRHYQAVLQAAVEQGLFPGNEQEVLRHAAAGEASTRHACLRGADGEPLMPATPSFSAGDAVQFTDRQGQRVTGIVRRVNQRTYTIAASDGERVYRVPISYAQIAPLEEELPEPAGGTPWHPGVAVEFVDAAGVAHRGQVVRVNLKTLTIRTEAGQLYRVGYSYPHLRRAHA
ncbi:MAG TPA: SprT-like domain-containing protein [Armatimonadota bacterium]|jgi:hypothetical protein|nr:SprT family zinc-dependent metalloprotease [Armatimonadota bacterium]HOM81711.1 SprT-like domain-containing protein [Armatimonadota bacterium]HPO72836.1 SprT-like domain-containing protein [Armatimonadota bacterium]HPT98272.1 SprT-like domain-containing protein [Armatimonadota bacterium]